MAISEGGDITGGNIAGDHCIDVIRTLADTVTTLQKQQKAEREAQARNRVSALVTSDILREVLDEETLRSAQEEYRYKL